ncbi:MAG: hypothetical protein HY226_03565 [Candidatus Vogelbacteria bacterium]|nr:hypothetical protein [Candidatus Vogelbacteria bacterium]
MAKIFRAGKPQPDKPWIGHEVNCRHCGCGFKLDASDKMELVSDWKEGDYYITNCPSCKNDITLANSLFS